MKLGVYGLWHLGLVTTAGLVQAGHIVTGLDLMDITDLNKGIIPIYEPGVSDMLNAGFRGEVLSFTNNPEKALSDAEVVWVTFDTPVNKEDRADIDYIENKILEIAPYIKDQTRLIISSQIMVGFTERLERILVSKYSKKIYIAYSPENLQLGNALERFLYPDRIIIGTHPDERDVFKPVFASISNQLIWMSIPSAEMVKHAINTYLAMSICFSNELARVCSYVGALSGDVEFGLTSDARIGSKYGMRSGNAYSGGTLGRDVKFLNRAAGYSPLLSSIEESNIYHKYWIYLICWWNFIMDLKSPSMMIFGLTYKDGADTLRNSGAIEYCDWLHTKGCIIYVYDPEVCHNLIDLPDYIHMTNDINDLKYCNIVSVFKNIYTFDTSLLRDKIVIDPNGYLEPLKCVKYFSIRRQYEVEK